MFPHTAGIASTALGRCSHRSGLFNYQLLCCMLNRSWGIVLELQRILSPQRPIRIDVNDGDSDDLTLLNPV